MYVEASSIENWDVSEQLSGTGHSTNMATAVVWLKKNAVAAQEQISSNLSAFDGISNVTQIESQAAILRIRFDYNRIRYAEIIDKINHMGYEARVVGY